MRGRECLRGALALASGDDLARDREPGLRVLVQERLEARQPLGPGALVEQARGLPKRREVHLARSRPEADEALDRGVKQARGRLVPEEPEHSEARGTPRRTSSRR